jgi:NADPH-dependent 2,4-dienoyl-CoA reductase/sulfur reductase-like enzyme
MDNLQCPEQKLYELLLHTLLHLPDVRLGKKEAPPVPQGVPRIPSKPQGNVPIHHLKYRVLMKSLIRTEFVVVGAGPVGLAAAMFLEKYKIAHVVLEQRPSLNVIPSCGWINMRTK